MSADWISITDGALTAAVNPLGAELSLLIDGAGREWMTDADPAFWSGRAPLLFPIVGALNGGRYRLDGVTYELPQHGFARRRRFDLVEQGADRLRFRLVDDAASRAVYPFAFALEAAYRLARGTLYIECDVTNRGDRAMPASFGFHPAFAWPLPSEGARDEHHIVFEAHEPGSLARLESGLIAGVDRATPLGTDECTLGLNDALFAQDALIWLDPMSRGVRYAGPDGTALDIAFPDAHQLAVWTKPGAAFVCIEPWWGHADPVGFAGELTDKPGMLSIAPDETRRFAMRVTPRSQQA